MVRCPWFKSGGDKHDLPAKQTGVRLGVSKACPVCRLRYVVTSVTPLRVRRDELGSAKVLLAKKAEAASAAPSAKAYVGLFKPGALGQLLKNAGLVTYWVRCNDGCNKLEDNLSRSDADALIDAHYDATDGHRCSRFREV